jgi:outer membrane protein assembly factor BamB
MMRIERLLGCACGAMLLSVAAFAADWPEWRGPRRDAVSTETGLLKEWPKEGPRLAWQAKDIGDGYATPSVAGNRVYVLSNRGLENEFVQALSTRDGKQIWATRLGKVGNPEQMPSFPAARSTPTVDGGLVYALGSDGDLACIETVSGAIRWRKNLRGDFGGVSGKSGYTESPLVDGDAVVVTPGGAQATMVALNKKTGETIWKSAVPGGDDAAFASAIVVEAGSRRQYAQFLAKGLVGVEAKTGQFLWRYDATGKGNTNIPTPVASGGYIYTTESHGPGGLIHLVAAGGGVAAEQVYLLRGLPSSIGGSVVMGATHYGTTGDGLVAADWATGKVLWKEGGTGEGAILGVEDRLYIHGENGDVILVEATREAYRQKGRFMPTERPKGTRGEMEKAWTYPVVAGGRLYVRELGSLWCYDISAR